MTTPTEITQRNHRRAVRFFWCFLGSASAALHVILVVRLRRHQPTRDYLARRLAKGKNQKRDHAMPQTLHCPRNLSRRPRIRSRNHVRVAVALV